MKFDITRIRCGKEWNNKIPNRACQPYTVVLVYRVTLNQCASYILLQQLNSESLSLSNQIELIEAKVFKMSDEDELVTKPFKFVTGK